MSSQLPTISFLERITNRMVVGKRSPKEKLRNKSFKIELQTILAIILMIGGVISGIATYAAFTEAQPFGKNPDTVIWLLNLDLIFLLLLFGLIAYRIVGLWSGRKRGLAGSHLHVRLVYIFSILVAVPTIIMTIFSAVFFHYGVQTWFSERVSTAVNESQAVAEAYLKEHTQTIRADTLAMANDINREFGMLMLNDQAFGQVVRTQAMLRDLSEAIVFDEDGRILARSGLTFSLEFEDIPYYATNAADDGDVVIMTGSNDDRVRALVKLDSYVDAYLFVGRMIDPQVLSHLAATKRATQDYATLQDRFSGLQVTLTMIFVVVGVLLLMIAIWFGLVLARQLVSPITTLITTADRVRAGDLSARVPDDKTLQEFEYLAQSFNRMTSRLQEQQNELIEANRQMDRRRHFTETVLTGVTSGVIGLDQDTMVTVANVSALQLLGIEKGAIIGKTIYRAIPEITELLELAHTQNVKITEGEVSYVRDNTRLTFLVRIAIELIGEEDMGVILTFDDITALQAAQRKAAWSDVARRIAHEIKNPLTPIQLSAERLHRRYLKQITDDPETFTNCTETIIRHVEDIGRMVDEFSSFARMPEPTLRLVNLSNHVKEALVLHRQAHSKISITLEGFENKQYMANIDSGQIRQAVTNLVQNSIDSLQEAHVEKPHIRVILGQVDASKIFIAICDNGSGFPKHVETSQLTEPYVTHKQKGTGLGLAIVKKIMEDHDGELILGTREWLEAYDTDNISGACAVLVLPIDEHSAQTSTKVA